MKQTLIKIWNAVKTYLKKEKWALVAAVVVWAFVYAVLRELVMHQSWPERKQIGLVFFVFSLLTTILPIVLDRIPNLTAEQSLKWMTAFGAFVSILVFCDLVLQ